MRAYSEDELAQLARDLVGEVLGAQSLPRIFLIGELGAGKSTLARAILKELGLDRASEGSPTFALVHEYRAHSGLRVLHADGYRLNSERELEDTGLIESLWDQNVLILFEWMDSFPETKRKLESSVLPTLAIYLKTVSESLRSIQIVRKGF